MFLKTHDVNLARFGRFGFSLVSLPVQFVLDSAPLGHGFEFISESLRFHFGFPLVSLRIDFDGTLTPFRIHFGLSRLHFASSRMSLRWPLDSTWISQYAVDSSRCPFDANPISFHAMRCHDGGIRNSFNFLHLHLALESHSHLFNIE